MKYVDEYRDRGRARALIQAIRALVAEIELAKRRPLKIMEVCGGHTHTIFRHGIEGLLPAEIELVHGPGCPVCVLPMGRVDDCVALAERPEVIFTTFGDAMRVPGSTVKPLVYATALDVGAIQPDTTFDCGNGRRVYGDKVLEDASAHGMLPLATMLAVSSNVGASRVADKLGRDRTVSALRAVGLGEGAPTTVDEPHAAMRCVASPATASMIATAWFSCASVCSRCAVASWIGDS